MADGRHGAASVARVPVRRRTCRSRSARTQLERRARLVRRGLWKTTRNEGSLASRASAFSTSQVLDLLLGVAEHLAAYSLLAIVVLAPRFVLVHGFARIGVDANFHDGSLDAVAATLVVREQPRRVDVVGVQITQRREPKLDVLSVRVVILALFDS